MKILHVIPSISPRFGGPATAIWPMTSALRDIGCQVDIATTDADSVKVMAEKPALSSPTTVFQFPVHGFRYLRSPKLSRWMKLNCSKYNIVHIHGLWNTICSTASRICNMQSIPVVIRPCGMLSEYSWQKSAVLKRIYWHYLEKYTISNAAAVHATSDRERSEILGVQPHAKVFTIPLGVSPICEDYVMPADWFRLQCLGSKHRPIILFLSRFHPKKRITDLLLPAFANVQNDSYLAIVGGDDPTARGYRVAVERKIADLQLTSRVKLFGHFTASECGNAYDCADLFILPSYSENFGQVVVEAMSHALPVVVTEGVQIADHIVACQGGSVVEANPIEIARTINYWLTNPTARRDAGLRGQAYVQTHFSWKGTATQVHAMYQSILSHV